MDKSNLINVDLQNACCMLEIMETQTVEDPENPTPGTSSSSMLLENKLDDKSDDENIKMWNNYLCEIDKSVNSYVDTINKLHKDINKLRRQNRMLEIINEKERQTLQKRQKESIEELQNDTGLRVCNDDDKKATVMY